MKKSTWFWLGLLAVVALGAANATAADTTNTATNTTTTAQDLEENLTHQTATKDTENSGGE